VEELNNKNYKTLKKEIEKEFTSHIHGLPELVL
jgi:hypothetical protein